MQKRNIRDASGFSVNLVFPALGKNKQSYLKLSNKRRLKHFIKKNVKNVVVYIICCTDCNSCFIGQTKSSLKS